MQAIDTRELYQDDSGNNLIIYADMYPEDESAEEFLPVWDDAEGQAFIAEMRDNITHGRLEYVYLTVRVLYNGAEIGGSSLGGVDHGLVGTDAEGHDIRSDALQLTRAAYDMTTVTHDADGKPLAAPAPYSVTGGSPLANVVEEAIGEALKWAQANGNAGMVEAIKAAEQWADPNNPKYAG